MLALVFRELPPKGPEGPRATTPDMIADARHAGRFLRMWGGLFGAICFSVCFLLGMFLSAGGARSVDGLLGAGVAGAAAGIALWVVGRRMQRRALELFRNGDEARGEVVSVELDHMVRMNGAHPWKVRYRFVVGGQSHEGSMRYWTPDPPPELDAGREVIVLHDAGDASRNLLWAAATPPLPPKDEAGTRARIGDAVWQRSPYDVADPDAARMDVDRAAEAEALAAADGREARRDLG